MEDLSLFELSTATVRLRYQIHDFIQTNHRFIKALDGDIFTLAQKVSELYPQPIDLHTHSTRLRQTLTIYLPEWATSSSQFQTATLHSQTEISPFVSSQIYQRLVQRLYEEKDLILQRVGISTRHYSDPGPNNSFVESPFPLSPSSLQLPDSPALMPRNSQAQVFPGATGDPSNRHPS